MSTFDITVPGESGVGGSGSGSAAFTTPGDFDGATIDSVVFIGTPEITSDSPTDDSLGIRWRIQTSGGVAVWGDYTTNLTAMTFALLGGAFPTSAILFNVSNPVPKPAIAVASDWDEVAFNANYAANMMSDNETCSWLAFTIRVTYTPVDIKQEHYRFANPITGADHESWPLVGTEDNSFEIELDTNYALIVKVGNDDAGIALALQLEYNVDGGGWNAVDGASSNVRVADSGDVDLAGSVVERLTASARTFQSTKLDEVDGEINFITFLTDNESELYYSLTARSADLSGGEEILFRITTPDANMVYTITPTATVATGGLVTALGTILLIGTTIVGGGTQFALGTSTFIGNVVSNGSSLKFGVGTITITGDCASSGTHILNETIIMVGEGSGVATHKGFAVTSFIGELQAGGGTQFAFGSITVTGDVAATAIAIQSALGTITATGDLVADGRHTAVTATSTFIGEVIAVGVSLGGLQSALGTITVFGESVSIGTIRAFGSINFSGEVAAIGDEISSVSAVGTITMTGDVAAAGFSQNDAAATSTSLGTVVSRGTSLARGTITMLGEGISEGTHNAIATISVAGDLTVGGGSLFAQATSTFIGEVSAIGSDISQLGASGTITYSGEAAASGTHLARGAIVASGQVVAAGVTLTRFATATITMFGLSATIGSKLGVGTVIVAGDLSAIGQSLLPVPAEIILFKGRVDAFPTVVCFIEASGSILLTGNIRTADMFISNHRDGTLGVKPHKVSFDSIFGSLSAPALTHILDDGNFLAHGSIIVKADLSAIIIEESCIAPTAQIRLTSFMHANDGVFVLGTRLARGTISVIGDVPTTSATLVRTADISLTSFMQARGRIIPEGNMSLLSQISDLNFSGKIGPATIDGRKQAVIKTSFGSIELYNNSEGAFYSIGGGGTIKEAFTTIIYAGTLIARGRKDQTQFGKGIILITGNFLDDGGDPKGIHINNLATINVSGTVAARGSILGKASILTDSFMDVGGGTHIQRATTSFIGQISQARPTVFHFARGTSTFIGDLHGDVTLVNNLSTITVKGAVTAFGQAAIKFAVGTINVSGNAVADGEKVPLNLVVVPTFVSAFSPGSCPVTTNNAVGTATGGRSPYTYQWTFISGQSVTINSPTNRITNFTRNSTGAGTGSYRLRVTDADSDTDQVFITVECECGLG